MEEIENNQQKLPNQEIDYFKIAKILISRWYWIVGSLVVFLIAANVYLWYTPKVFATAGTMKLEDRKSEIADLSTIIATGSERGVSKIQSETSVIQSRSVVLSAIKDLEYPISFYVEGRVRTSELYPQRPLEIEKLNFDSLNFYRNLITFKPVNKSSFTLAYKIGESEITKNYLYNHPVTIANTTFTIKFPGDINKKSVFLFKFNVPEDFIGRVQGNLRTAETVKYSNILSVQLSDANPQFAADVVNNIMKEYLLYDRNRKTQSATQMINFIDDQLKFLSSEVKGSEKSIESFKQKNRLMEVSTKADAALGKAKDLESQVSILKLQLVALEDLKQQISKDKNNLNLNFNAGSGTVDPSLNVYVERLDKLLTQRTELSKTYTSNSAPIQEINRDILQIKNNALMSVNTTIANVNRSINFLNSQLGTVNQEISVLPGAERDLISLKRDFDINEKVYSFLSEKKLEAQISRSGILPGATIIEPAAPNFSPVAPNEHDIQRSAIIFGLATGLGLIILIRILNPYIYDKETIESLTSIPIIGVIRKFPNSIDETNTQALAISKPKSVFAESVRSVRTNLNFLASDKARKIICVTSEVAGEGKSFVSYNLASTLALIDKKVVLIAADLRRSKLHRTFNVPNDIGLSNYLSFQNTLEEVILQSNQQNFDFIVSGPVPPNPSELLHTDRMKELIAELSNRYDIIMLDTAPIGLVSDAIPVIRMSDINIFVIRSGKSKFNAATIPQRIAHEYNLDNTVIVLNAYAEDILHSRYYTTKFTGSNYGSSYYYYSDYSGYEASGYYLDEDEKKWWNFKRWFK